MPEPFTIRIFVPEGDLGLPQCVQRRQNSSLYVVAIFHNIYRHSP